MKVKSFLATAVLLVSFITTTSFAATTGNINLQGTVTSDYQITVTPSGNNLTLAILTGATLVVIAAILEYANDGGGYKIQASSANNGLLKNGSLDSVAYTVTYGSGSATSLTTSAQTLYSSSSLSAPTSSSQNLKISFTGKPTALAGTYSDTITLTISTP